MNILKSYSDLSIKHGIITPEKLAKIAKKLDFKSIALTDFMNMFGFLRFYKACKAENIKPILGVELLIKHPEIDNFKILAYAKSNKGLKNLFNILSLSYTEYGQNSETKEPFLPFNFYQLYDTKDIIFTNGGINGFFGSCFRKNKENLILDLFTDYQNNFDGFYLEINRFSTQNYYSKDIINKYNSLVIDYYKKYNVKFVFTNPIMYENIEDYESHLIRVSANRSIPLNSDIFSATIKDYYSHNMYFLTQDNLRELNIDIIDLEQKFSEELVNSINVEVETGKNYLPKFATPNGETEEEYFLQLSKSGLEKRLIQNNIKENEVKIYKDRLEFELNIINQMGFVGYFLIVQDFINWAKENDIPVGPGRGSGAGSLIAYCLGITDLNPIPYDLLFERFLNPERVSMPDFDIDFCQERRGEVIHYVQQKYGKEAVSQIMTTGTMASKSVVKDVARALGKPLGLANSIANKIDPTISLMESYNDINNTQNGLMELIRSDDEAALIWEHSLKLEGLTKSVGKHAAGVLIAPNKIIDFCPLYQMEDVPVSQLDKNDVEAVGLVKFDFLGLRNLTIIKNTIKMIKENHNFDLVFTEDFSDVKTYELLQKGNTTGVFQLESSGMKKYLMRLKPNCFEDIVAILALYRPGPLGSGMIDSFIKRKAWERENKISRKEFFDNLYDNYLKNAKVNISRADFENQNSMEFDKVYEITNYFTKELEECLKPTYGVIVYQEQVMKISQIIAGYSLGGADLLRRAMGKKKPEEMAKQRSVFLEGAQKQGYSNDLAMHLFDLMESFAEYGFNKSHSAGYAVITYQTAFLKAHYPAEFMAATLQSENEDTNKLEILIKDCYRNNIMVIPPSINLSKEFFSVNTKGQIIYGLTGLKKISNEGIKAILEERDLNGKYISFNDFLQRNFFSINKGVLESLILSGCFDSLDSNINRGIYYNSIEEIMNKKKKLNTKSKKAELFLKEDAIKDFQISEECFDDKFKMTELELAKKEREFIGYELVHSAYEALCKSINDIYKNNKDIMEELKVNNKIEVFSPTKLMKELSNFVVPNNSTVVKKLLIAGEIEKTPHFEDQFIRINIRDLKENIVCFLDKGFEFQWFKKHKEMLLEGRVVYFKASVEIINDGISNNKLKKLIIENFIDLVNNE